MRLIGTGPLVALWRSHFILSSEPPKFTWTPARVSVVRPGQSKVFECQVSGTPEIDIYWFREGSEISPSNRHKMAFLNSVATLEVCRAETRDSGLYYCEARNEAGSESCSMELKVKGQSRQQALGYVKEFQYTWTGSSILKWQQWQQSQPYQLAT